MKRVLAFSAAMVGAAFGLGVGVAALAQDAPLSDGVYVRAGAGVSFVNDLDQGFTYNPDAIFIVPPPTGQTISNGTGFIAAAALGFDYADGIRTELEYRYASSSVDGVSTVSAISGPGAAVASSEDINAHLLMANFYFDFYNDSALTPFIGGGVGGAFVENENAQRDAALALQARAGVSLAMGAGFSADLEYIYLRTNELVFGIDPDDFEPGGPAGPSIGGDRYQGSNIMVSLRKQF